MSEPSPSTVAFSAPDRVALKSLQLTNFRNYASASVAFGGELVALTGENGAGKTNLLEAISLLTPGRGLRRARYEEITRIDGDGGWAVAATLAKTARKRGSARGSPKRGSGSAHAAPCAINGAPAEGAEALLEYLRVLWLTPAMDGLFTGPAAERRRFLDRLVLTIDAAHGRRAREFERLLTQRNRLLEENANAAWLDAVEAELAERAVAVALARAETAALLSARMRRAEASALFPVGRLSLAGDFDRAVAGRSAAQTELWYRDALRAGRSRRSRRRTDASTGRTEATSRSSCATRRCRLRSPRRASRRRC